MNDQKPSENKIITPKIFISYSWTSDAYKAWVLQLATELAENNIDVELDQWSLKDGDDTYVYMEQMVNNLDIQKVIILCDKKYKEKANDRQGGAGVEATIMTPEIYKTVKLNAGEQKFIPVITERDPDTKEEFVPTFLGTKKYIDLSAGEHYADNFEQLVRTIHNKPRLTKPKPGKMPDYLLEDERINLPTSSSFRRAADQVKNGKQQAVNAVKDYFSIFAENLKEYDIQSETISTTQITERMQEMLLLRDEVINLIDLIVRYSTEPRMFEELHNFFESLIPYLELRKFGNFYPEWSADHYRFFVHELFLYTIALMLKHRRFEEMNELLGQGYYQQSNRYTSEKGGLTNYCIFDTYCAGLDYYNSRLQRQFYSIYAHFLSERATRNDIKFQDITQADFFLFVRRNIEIGQSTSHHSTWYPDTLLHGRFYNTFEIFSRAQSKKFFNKLQIALGGATKEQFEEFIERLKSNNREYFGNNFNSGTVAELCGAARIATEP